MSRVSDSINGFELSAEREEQRRSLTTNRATRKPAADARAESAEGPLVRAFGAVR